MGSENPSGADNQQERLPTNDWLVGFVDGEGCFSCPIFRSPSMRLGWQVQPTFTVVQSVSSRAVLDEMVSFFGCGKVYVNHRHDNHREDLCSYQVFRFGDLRDVVVPFFQANPLRTAKRDNFAKFVEVIRTHRAPSAPHGARSHRDRGDRRDDEPSKAVGGVENPQRPYADPLLDLARRRRDGPFPTAT